MRLALILALMLAVSAHAAEDVTGNELLQACTGGDVGRVNCLYFLMGVQTAAVLTAQEYEIRSKLANRFFCMPPEVTAGQAREILVNYLRAHPVTRHHPAGLLAYQALQDAYPCGASARSP